MGAPHCAEDEIHIETPPPPMPTAGDRAYWDRQRAHLSLSSYRIKSLMRAATGQRCLSSPKSFFSRAGRALLCPQVAVRACAGVVHG